MEETRRERDSARSNIHLFNGTNKRAHKENSTNLEPLQAKTEDRTIMFGSALGPNGLPISTYRAQPVIAETSVSREKEPNRHHEPKFRLFRRRQEPGEGATPSPDAP